MSSTTTTYAYDGDGVRASTTAGGSTTRYVYDVGGGLPLLLEDGTRKYVWGAHGLAYAVVGSGNGTIEVAHTDGLGSVRSLTDAAGAVTQTYETDEFGIPTLTQGTSGQRFGFTGEPRDAETGSCTCGRGTTTLRSDGSCCATPLPDSPMGRCR